MIARGEKVIENRTWPTSYRGPLLIHAGKSTAWLAGEDSERYEPMEFGAIVATADLVQCVRLESLPPELQAHEHANGPWCWVLNNIKRVTPVVPMRGAQGLWEC